MTTSREEVDVLGEGEGEGEGESWTSAMGMSGVTCSSATRAGS